MIPPIIIFLLILSFLVFIHELGHFLTARKAGVGVEEFGIGIPPRAYGKKIGKTIYSINWLPFGGFVKINGEDFEHYDPKDNTSFINKKPWQKALILSAGIIMNTLLAFVIFTFVLSMNGFRSSPILLMGEYQFPYGTTEPVQNVITFLTENGPAQKAGIEFADQIISLQYQEELVYPANVDEVRAFMKDKDGKSVVVSTQNINTLEKNTYEVMPVMSQELQIPTLGVALTEGVRLAYTTPSQKAFSGILHSANIMDYSFFALGGMVKRAFHDKNVGELSQGVSGPIGIFGAVKTILQTGGNRVVYTLLDLTAMLSLSLAVMNILPIPALDGGRLTFVLAEWITGKRPSQKLEAKAHQIGFMLLLALLVLITVKDIFALF